MVLGSDQYKAVVPVINLSSVDYRLHAGQVLEYAKPVDLVVAKDANVSVPSMDEGPWLQAGERNCEFEANGRNQPRLVA